MFASIKAEKAIIKQIEELEMYRLAFKRAEIEQMIKMFYYQGTFSEKKYQKMIDILVNRCNEIYNRWEAELVRSTDERYKLMMEKYGVKP